MAKAKKLPSGSWRVQAKKSVNGTVMRKSFTDTDRKRAELAAIEWQTNFSDVQIKMMLGNAAEKYINKRRPSLSAVTIKTYEGYKKDTFPNCKI